MTDYFITNKGDTNLKQAIIDKVSGSSKIDILVGYFYWSGLEQLYKD